MVKVFQYTKCGTCRKALKWLDSHGVAYECVDIVQTPPSKAQLATVLKLTGLPLNKLFNTSGQAYREGGYKDRIANMSQAEALAELAANGKLVKRPLLLADEFAVVGFREADYSARF